MSEGGIKLKFGWLDKLKRIKHIEIYILIMFVAIVGILLFSTKKQNTVKVTDNTTVVGYVNNIETKLEHILSKIDGVSKVNVMITLNLDDTIVENSKLKITTFPSIKGVLITAKGVDNTFTKMKVLHAVETVIDVSQNNVQIFSSK